MPLTRPQPRFGPPAILENRFIQLMLLAGILVPFFLPIPPVLRRHPIIGHLGDQVHVPFLAILTLILYWFGPLRGRLGWAAATALFMGGAIEFLQLLVGRGAMIQDFLLDVAGVGLAVGLVIWLGHRRSLGRWVMVAIAVLLAGQLYFLPGLIMASLRNRSIFPMLADLEGSHDRWLWQDTYDAQLEFPEDTLSGNRVLRLTSGPPSKWPGAQLGHFPPDWSDYTTLKVNVRHITPGRETVPFSLRLDDFPSRRDNVWISDYFQATDQWQTFSMTFVDRQVRHGDRLFDHTDVYKVLVFLSDKQDSTAIEVDNIRLE